MDFNLVPIENIVKMNALSSETYVIVLAGGEGSRLRPLTKRIPKPLIEIDGVPIISRIINTYKELGIGNFLVVIGYKGNELRALLSRDDSISIEFVEQKRPLGMADALELSFKHIMNLKKNIKNFFVTAADILYSSQDIEQMFRLYQNTQADMILSLMESTDIEIAKGHGNVGLIKDYNPHDAEDVHQGLKIIDIIEKPSADQILSNYYSLPFYLFNRKIIKYLEDVPLSKRGEKELQDAIKMAIKSQETVKGFNIIKQKVDRESVGKYHLTYLEDILTMNFRFLEGTQIDNYQGIDPVIRDPVKLREKIEFRGEVILGPNVIIQDNCTLGDSCELRNCILYENVKLDKSCKLEWCLIDQNLKIPAGFSQNSCYIGRNEEGMLEIIPF